VEKVLFSITCATCRARLAVRNANAIGAILECPKCGSMVEVAPPEDWKPEEETEQKLAPKTAAATAAAAASPVAGADAAGQPTTADSQPVQAPPVQDSPAAPSEPAATPSAEEATTPGGVDDAELAPRQSPSTYASAAEMAWRKWLLLSATGIGAVVVAVGALSLLFSSSDTPSPEQVEAREPAEKQETEASEVAEEATSQSKDAEVVARWLPDETQLAFDFRPWRLNEVPRAKLFVDQFDIGWKDAVYPMLRGFSIGLEKIERVSWACTDLSVWPSRSVAVIYLREGQDARQLEGIGKAAGFDVDGHTCRFLPNSQWDKPFAVIDERTIVTGDGELLCDLSGREGPTFQSVTIERLAEAAEPAADFSLMVDLVAARAADWRMPNSIMDIWKQGKQPWHVVCDMPDGLGVSLTAADRTTATLTLPCETETIAQQVRVAVDELVSAGGKLATAQMDTLVDFLKAGKIKVGTAHQYRFVLEKLAAGLKESRATTVETTVSLRVDLGEGCSALPAALVDSREAIRADWLAAALVIDRKNQERLAEGLSGYSKAEGHFPEGAVGGAALAPETRLSWIATMLPYYGHPDWHQGLQFGYRWNGSQNRPVTERMLPEVVNPALGPSITEAGFPVTHYVGVGGLGKGAALLPASDPRAGVFGLGRVTKSTEISDGASNTIAVLGVTKKPGAWAAGGDPTVRSLVNKPYVNGPDGFGSGQPDGMLVGMADGSVRFVSRGVDSELIERMVTIAGGEEVDLALLDVKPLDLPPIIEEPKDGPPEPLEDGIADDGMPDDVPDDLADDVADDEALDPGDAVEDEAEVVVERPPLAAVNVAARLADPIEQLELDGMPLLDAVGLLSDMSTIPITIDPDALHQLGVGLKDPVTVKLTDATVGDALDAVLGKKKLGYVEQDGKLLATTSPAYRSQLRERTYDVGDLTGGDEKGTAAFAELVRQMVAPDSWKEKGGSGSMKVEGGKLSVAQTGPIHYQLLVFCEKLRRARGKPAKSKLDARRYSMKSRAMQAGPVLAKPLTANFQDPAPLKEVLAYLGGLAEVDILVDQLALAQAGLSADMPASLAVEKQPLLLALGRLLAPFGLSCRVVDSETLQITTRKTLAQRGEIEFYRVDGLLGGFSGNQSDPNAEKLIEDIKSGVAGATWSDAGGAGRIHFDPQSRCLIVLQSQPVQRAVETAIVKLKSAGK